MTEEYVQTDLENGACVVQLVNPPPTPTHKSHGLSQSDLRGLYSLSEMIKIDQLEAYINDKSYQVLGGAVGIDDDAALVGVAGATYRQLMRTGFAAFAKANSGIDMHHQTTQLILNCQDLLGLLDSPQRKAIILQGKQL